MAFQRVLNNHYNFNLVDFCKKLSRVVIDILLLKSTSGITHVRGNQVGISIS